MIPIQSQRIQALADRFGDVTHIADASFEEVENDNRDTSEIFEAGLLAGMLLQASRVRSNSQLFVVTFEGALGDTGRAFFIGTEEEVADRLSI